MTFEEYTLEKAINEIKDIATVVGESRTLAIATAKDQAGIAVEALSTVLLIAEEVSEAEDIREAEEVILELVVALAAILTDKAETKKQNDEEQAKELTKTKNGD